MFLVTRGADSKSLEEQTDRVLSSDVQRGRSEGR